MKKTPLLKLLLLTTQLIYAEQLSLKIGIQEGGGLFAELHKVMQSLIHYENRLANVDVDWTSEFYPYKNGIDENGWDVLFEPIHPPITRKPSEELNSIFIDSTSMHHELHDQECAEPWVNYDAYLPYRRFVHDKLEKYIKIKQDVQDKLKKFYDRHMSGKRCIGVHARIAKAHAALVPGRRLPKLNDYCQEIDTLLAHHAGEDIVIFVASDSHHAVGEFKKRYGDRLIYIDAHRSPLDQDPCTLYTHGAYLKEHKDVWHRTKPGNFGGITSLLDCLLLSKCDYIIHTTSNLAFFSTYFNPEMKSVYLPKGLPFKKCRFSGNPSIVNPYLNPQ